MARTASSKGSKGSTTNQRGDAEKIKLKVTLGRETVRLLRLEAFGRDCSLGQVVEELVRSSPRRFVLVDRGVKGHQDLDGSRDSTPTNSPAAPGTSRTLGLLSETG
jgi:hypothetical protein